MYVIFSPCRASRRSKNLGEGPKILIMCHMKIWRIKFVQWTHEIPDSKDFKRIYMLVKTQKKWFEISITFGKKVEYVEWVLL